MSDAAKELAACYVAQQLRAYGQSTRGIATTEWRKVFEDEAFGLLQQVRAEALRDAADEIHDAVWTGEDVAQTQRRRDTWDWILGASDGVEFAARRLAERADKIERNDDDQPE